MAFHPAAFLFSNFLARETHMKIGGIDPRTLPNIEVLILPRGDQNIVFRARGLQDMEEFMKLCPEPNPPGKLTKDGWQPNPEDKNYISVLTEWNKRKLAYIVVKSLEPSDIEWDTVEIANPGTWSNWESDLKKGGVTQIECNRVVSLVLEANCLDEAKLEKARKVFQLGQAMANAAISGPSIEPVTTPSGEPAHA
jgi:hypothetical protein